MSRPSHITPDTHTLHGWHHGDELGTIHSGKRDSCEKCRVMRWRQQHAAAAYAETVKNAPAVRMTSSEAETVRAVNALLQRKRESRGGWLLAAGLASAAAIWLLAVYGAVRLIAG